MPKNDGGNGNGGKGSPIEKIKSCVRAGLKKDPSAGIPSLAKSCASKLGIKLKLKKK